MELSCRPSLLAAILLVFLSLWPSLRAAETEAKAPMLLKKGARIVMMGDSITEGKNYSKIVELYFVACQPGLDVHTLHLGWSGIQLRWLLGGLRSFALDYKPDIVTLCAGGADGGYGEFSPNLAETYTSALNNLVETLRSAGATAIVCSPCAMDPHFASATGRKLHDETLIQLSDLARKTAETCKVPFADVHGAVSSAKAKAQAAFGEDYPVCGSDGIHPGPNGGLVIAYELLKAMGVDGNIGTITLDMKGSAAATEGHKILSFQNGKAEIESARYPFCFTGDEKSPNGTRSILPFVSFNQDLNRFMLTVKNLDGEKARVTWGTASKIFTKKELMSGINLAEAFAEGNPFSEKFQKADAAVYAKQILESECKQVIQDMNNLMDKDAESTAQLNEVRKKVDAKIEKSHVEIREMLTPVKYTLTVTPEA